mmetsp:Transcript_102565/g.289720  ORF Transcript_102565/g.289720 Transcript_102565/m.289720 type:complete len:232 (-) Transcript_102565:704-1399(-)
MLTDHVQVTEAKVRKLEGDIEEAERSLEPKSIAAVTAGNEALLLQHSDDGAGTFVTEEVRNVSCRLRAPERRLVWNHPTESQFLDVFNRVLQHELVPVLRKERRLVADPIPDRHRHALLQHRAEFRANEVLKFFIAFPAEDADGHALRGICFLVQFGHLLVQVDATFFGLVHENLVVADRNVERVLWIGALVENTDGAPKRLSYSALEFRVHGIDFALCAIPGQQWLSKEP